MHVFPYSSPREIGFVPMSSKSKIYEHLEDPFYDGFRKDVIDALTQVVQVRNPEIPNSVAYERVHQYDVYVNGDWFGAGQMLNIQWLTSETLTGAILDLISEVIDTTRGDWIIALGIFDVGEMESAFMVGQSTMHVPDWACKSGGEIVTSDTIAARLRPVLSRIERDRRL